MSVSVDNTRSRQLWTVDGVWLLLQLLGVMKSGSDTEENMERRKLNWQKNFYHSTSGVMSIS
jgi:hypothetical protein